MQQINEKYNNTFGLYRYDGLGVTDKQPQKVEAMKKDICSIFKRNGLRITITANKKIVNFLDVTLNLNSGEHMVFNKCCYDSVCMH